jgi:DNA polymerase-4
VRPDRIRKSVGCERTYSEDLVTDLALQEALERIIDMAWQRIENNRARGRTVTLKVKFADFRQITRGRSCGNYLAQKSQFAGIARELLGQLLPVPDGVRLLGLTLSGLAGPAAPQLATRLLNVQHTFDF